MNDASTSARAGAAGQVRREWEWFWRFLAVVMLLSACWVGWIAVQLSAPGIVLPEAFAAAAQARANQNVSGRIGEPPAGPGASAPAEALAAAAVVASGAAEAPAAPEAMAGGTSSGRIGGEREPPVNVDKLRLSGSIETPIPDKPRRAARRAEPEPGASQ